MQKLHHKSLRVHEFTSSRVHGFTSSLVHLFAGSGVQEFMGSWAVGIVGELWRWTFWSTCAGKWKWWREAANESSNEI